MLARITLAAAVVAVAAASSPSRAADAEGCGALRLIGGDKGIEIIDNPPAGKSIGDVRAGWRKLLGAGGAEVASVRFVATMTAPGDGSHGDVLASQYFVSFGDDWIATVSLYELANADAPTRGAGNATLVVTGGTGRFSGAGGTITIEAGDPPTYVFDVACRG